MKVADYTSPRKTPISLRVMLHSASDLLCALWIRGDRISGDSLAELEIGDAWFDDFESDLSPATKERLEEVGCGDIWIALLPLLPEAGDGGTITSFLEYLDAVDPVDLRYRLIQLHDKFDDDVRELFANAAEGDQEAVDALLDRTELEGIGLKAWREAMRHLLSLEPAATHELLVGALKSVYDEAFIEREQAFRPLLDADVRSKRAMARRVSPERMLELATSGINITEEHARNPIVLIPTMVARPWVVFAPGNDFFVLGYPVGDEHLHTDGDAPPPWLVKLHKALGDERRLKILKLLAEGDATLAELAERSDVAKSTLHHHLMLLRTAGLVRVHVGADKKYSLREDTITDAASVLDHYIHGTTGREDA